MNPASEVNEDFVDRLAALQSNQVDFSIVGAYALAAHGFPRATVISIFSSHPQSRTPRRSIGALLEFAAAVSAHRI
jgi:hypothetical protein